MTRRRYRTTVPLEYFSRTFPAGTVCTAASANQIDTWLGKLPAKRTGDPINVMRWAIRDGEYSYVEFDGDLWFRFVPTSQLEAIDD